MLGLGNNAGIKGPKHGIDVGSRLKQFGDDFGAFVDVLVT